MASRGHVYWIELTEPTFPNLLAGIDKAMAPGLRFSYAYWCNERGYISAAGQSREATTACQNDPNYK